MRVALAAISWPEVVVAATLAIVGTDTTPEVCTAKVPVLVTAIVCEARDFTLQRAAGAKLHPAARAFQAFRMLVNRETGNLERLLTVAPDLLKPGGRLAIISFHSGEDRRVKQAFRDGLRAGVYRDITPEPLVGTPEEIQQNPRARSAKLRWAERT